jgi:glycyl-tRNA synthetase beta chain
VKILADLPELTGLAARLRIGDLLDRAGEPFSADADRAPLLSFMADRLAYLLEQRGYDVRTVRAVLHGDIAQVSPLEARLKLEALTHMTGSDALLGVAALLKRVKNITKGVSDGADWQAIPGVLTEPAERTLWSQVDASAPGIRSAAARGDYREAFASIAALQPPVAKFFDDVMVMAEDTNLRQARLSLVAALRDLILGIADLSEIATDM